MTNVLIVENEPLYLESYAKAVASIFPGAVIHEARTAAAALEKIAQHGAPDWVLLDLGLPDSQGLQALQKVAPKAAESRIVVVSGNDDQDVRERAMGEGAFAFIAKEFEVEAQFDALKLVLAQRVQVAPPRGVRRRPQRAEPDWLKTLTRAEARILDCLKAGDSNKQIASLLKVTEATVKAHTKTIYKKAGLAEHRGNKRTALLNRLGIGDDSP